MRTVGLAGLAGLGACFGPVLAIDSPSAREVGQFNWGSTFWHELTHTFTLGLTGNRVPRWFSEGISVYEERRARPGWGDDVSLEFLRAFQQGLLLSLAVATATALGAVTAGVMASLLVVRYRFPGRGLLTTLLQSPMMIPEGMIVGPGTLRRCGEIAGRRRLAARLDCRWLGLCQSGTAEQDD